jgi:hypothetical protein
MINKLSSMFYIESGLLYWIWKLYIKL